jgi:hypothetical protein
MQEQLTTNAQMRNQESSETGVPPYADELRPNDGAGTNQGARGPHPELTAPTAFDLKQVHNDVLNDWNDADLKQVPIIPQGSRLEQGATYIDLKLFEPREFSARGDMVAGQDDWYVLKSSVPYTLWNRLIGVENPERLDEASGDGR